MAGLIETALGGGANVNEIQDLGSDYASAKVIADTDGTDLATPDEWSRLPYRESFKISRSSTDNSKSTEGKVKVVTSTDFDYQLETVFMQNSLGTLFELPEVLSGKLLLLLLELNNIAVDGNFFYVLMMAKQLKLSDIASSSTQNTYTWQLYKATSNVTVTGADGPPQVPAAGAAGFATDDAITINSGTFFGRLAVAES